MKRNFFRLVSAIVTLGWMGGCVVSEQPLSASRDAKPDARLVGTWHSEKDADAKKDFRLSYDPQGLGHLTQKAEDGNWKPAAQPTTFFVTRTERVSYLNALVPDDGDRPDADKHYHFFKYEVSGDGKTLRLWMLKTIPFQKAVLEAKLKGRIKGGDKEPPEQRSVVLQDSSGNILRFLEALPPSEAFADLDALRKVD